MAVIGSVLNFAGGVLLIYYGDKTGAVIDKGPRDTLLSRWVFYLGVACFCAGFFLILLSMIF
jgi:hypothetical protein